MTLKSYMVMLKLAAVLFFDLVVVEFLESKNDANGLLEYVLIGEVRSNACLGEYPPYSLGESIFSFSSVKESFINLV